MGILIFEKLIFADVTIIYINYGLRIFIQITKYNKCFQIYEISRHNSVIFRFEIQTSDLPKIVK